MDVSFQKYLETGENYAIKKSPPKKKASSPKRSSPKGYGNSSPKREQRSPRADYMYQSESDYPRPNKQYAHVPSSGYG